jgi:hypothetical protein
LTASCNVHTTERGKQPAGPEPPRYRPRERFWPYADLPEHLTDEEIAKLDPDLHAELFGTPPRPLSVTIVFPVLETPDYARALELARASAEYRETGSGSSFRHRARFWPSEAAKLRDLFDSSAGSMPASAGRRSSGALRARAMAPAHLVPDSR